VRMLLEVDDSKSAGLAGYLDTGRYDETYAHIGLMRSCTGCNLCRTASKLCVVVGGGSRRGD
jgi:hypothetical protein